MLLVSNHSIAGSIPAEYGSHTSFFSFSISEWLPTAKCVCLCMNSGIKGKKEESSLAKNRHREPCGERPGSSIVVVRLAISSVLQFQHTACAVVHGIVVNVLCVRLGLAS